jgi:hypothetical protein
VLTLRVVNTSLAWVDPPGPLALVLLSSSAALSGVSVAVVDSNLSVRSNATAYVVSVVSAGPLRDVAVAVLRSSVVHNVSGAPWDGAVVSSAVLNILFSVLAEAAGVRMVVDASTVLLHAGAAVDASKLFPNASSLVPEQPQAFLLSVSGDLFTPGNVARGVDLSVTNSDVLIDTAENAAALHITLLRADGVSVFVANST